MSKDEEENYSVIHSTVDEAASPRLASQRDRYHHQDNDADAQRGNGEVRLWEPMS